MKIGRVIVTVLAAALFFAVPFNTRAEEISRQESAVNSVPLEVKYRGDVNIAKTRAEVFLKNIGRPTLLEDGIMLKNLNGEYEAVSFNMPENGYIIVNIKDLTIPELSFESLNPFDNIEDPVYNGILNYYNKTGKEFVSLKDNSSFSREQFKKVYSKERNDNKKEFFSSLDSDLQDQLRYVTVEKYINGSLNTWTILGGHCGSIASAICMRYYYDYVDSNYVPSGSTGSDNLIALMQQYVGSGGTSTSDLVNGLNQFIVDRNVNNSTLSSSSFSFAIIKNKINNSRPVIIDTDNHPTYGEHWIVAHGYFTSPVDGNYVIVNNGWGSNNIWLEANNGYLDDLVYFIN